MCFGADKVLSEIPVFVHNKRSLKNGAFRGTSSFGHTLFIDGNLCPQMHKVHYQGLCAPDQEESRGKKEIGCLKQALLYY